MPDSEKIRTLASEILRLSRNTLLVNLRFLDAALYRLEQLPVENATLMTDGRYILYDPVYILRGYKTAKEIPVRNYLHILMHCIFRHMFVDPSVNRDYWNLACDIAVENIIAELDVKSCYTDYQDKQQPFFQAIKDELKYVTAEKIYQYLRTTYPDPVQFDTIRRLFFADDHDIWYMTDQQKEDAFDLSSAGGTEHSVEGVPVDSEIQSSSSATAIAADWQQVAERMQVDMETFNKERGKNAGSLTRNLQAVNREKYDYSSFLRKFAVMGERMQINDDEFDYVFYTYGLKLYEKMPLIEPLEYKEVKAIREFVIAIDTSGSTSGELVQKFVQKTYNILKTTESFFSKINLHIIQCDAAIQEDVRITSQEEFDAYIKTMKIHGLCGTDFRPVFEYVDQLRKQGAFMNLKGLVYFTDGYGEFPVKKPEYETAFVFLDDAYNNPNVPPWAIKLVLQRDEI